jgi:hypothetical protein
MDGYLPRSTAPVEPGTFLNRLRHEASQLTTRATNVDALLDHHLSGPNPVAFVEFIRGEVLDMEKRSRGPQSKFR